jgi:hypothetical protein
MGKGWTYNSGDWNATCDSCGRKFKASQLKKRWDGLMVCEADWEPRHSLDFVRSRADKQTPPWIRPKAQLIFNHILGVYEVLPISETFSRTAVYYRDEADNIYLTDVITDRHTGRVLADSIAVSDGLYFLEDYLVSNEDYVENSIRLSVQKPLLETAALIEFGTITLNPYVDLTYFAEDYMEVTQQF